uniref:Rho GTPase activating protein 30 n=1 Tax=Pseudonaja textilis TaxID=8673 RepID=A0A670Z2J2_PSETE
MKALQKVKRKGPAKDRVFGCDLVEHLQSSGHDIPQVLKICTEFVEQHGVKDGIYRISGISSNIQKLRLEFDNDCNPDLNKDVYLQDIHCVSSLCKAYFRELPNPLLTYQLYDKFAEAVAIQLEESRLEKIKEVLKELPSPHHRTLEFLMKHLVRMASFSSQTNMHARNLAIVWAPNLLRSKDIEVSGFNGTAAFMEVRIQSIVVEFILNHVEQIFGNAPLGGGTRESIRRSLLALSPVVLPKYCTPYHVPSMLNQGDGPPQMRPYHTIIELNESKRKGSLKAKKWKSIFNLGRSNQDSKRKLNKPEDKDDKLSKMRLRPAKSMDSLSCVPSIDDVHLGSEIPPKLECFDGPVSLDSSFSESAHISAKSKCEDMQEEATKSEPTTPKTSRSGLIGGTSQGRSPKSSRNRAEKCAGVHISGPFSVTVPFHITSNLTLSRLTRGLECPAPPPPCPGAGGRLGHAHPATSPYCETWTEFFFLLAHISGTNFEAEMESRMSMEVEDSFSFLDSPDGWIDNVMEEEQLQTDPGKGPEVPPRGLDTFPSMEDDLGSGFMNEMIAAGMEVSALIWPSLSIPDLNHRRESIVQKKEFSLDTFFLLCILVVAFLLVAFLLLFSTQQQQPCELHTSYYYYSFPASLSDSCMDSEDFSLTASSPKPCLENLLQKSQLGLPVEASYAPKHDFLDGRVEMKLTSTMPRIQQVKSFPVVPPKPQFAKVPPALKPVIPSKECLSGTPQKQRWTNWHCRGSMSFDEAVALAKDKHVPQAPMRRMQTYSYGDMDGSHGSFKMEKTSTPHKPVLRSPQRPLSCMSPAGPSEAHLSGKMPCSPGLPDNIPKGVPTPRLEGSNSYSQDFPPRSRVSLSKIGRRLSVSDEACFGLSHERR